MNYWLMKSEPDSFGIDQLKKDKKTVWEGVRNYQARNFMMKMKKGDLVLFHHSSCPTPGIYGTAKVISAPHPDLSQFDKKGHYFEPRATKEKPVWHCVDVGFVSKAKTPLSLTLMKNDPELSGMMVRQTGSRLSVQPVSEKHFKHIEFLLVT
jgi:predicted RNA-binding protein with PUA-like domain